MALKIENDSIVVQFDEGAKFSDTWFIGEYQLRFINLQANEELSVKPGDYLKVIEGMLSDPLRLPFVGPFAKASTVVKEDVIKASKNSIILVVSPGISQILSPQQLPVLGPYNEILSWKQVCTLIWGANFRDTEFYNLRGWDIRNSSGKHIAYIQAWLAGNEVNCGNHNHSEMKDNTFREIHLCLANGSGQGGMVWLKGEEEFFLPLRAGEEHGPFWEWSEDLTKVVYPVHRWQAGRSNFMDFWLAIEFPPHKAT